MMTRYSRKILLLLLLLTLVLAGCTKKDTGNVVAEVNGEQVTRQEFNEEMEKVKERYQKQGIKFDSESGKKMLQALEADILDQMIQEKVIYQEAKKQGIEVKDEDVKQHLENLKAQYGEETFNQILEQNGLTVEELEDYFRLQLLEEGLFAKVTAGIEVTDQELEDYYNKHQEDLAKVKVRHILIEAREGQASDAEMNAAREEAIAIIKELDAGADFVQVAREKSADSGSKDNGGLIEYYFTKDDPTFVKEFVEGAFDLAEGEYSPVPVKSPYGFHIIKVEDRKDTFAELKEDLREEILTQRKNEKFGNYFNQLMEEADIKNYLQQNQEDKEQ